MNNLDQTGLLWVGEGVAQCRVSYRFDLGVVGAGGQNRQPM